MKFFVRFNGYVLTILVLVAFVGWAGRITFKELRQLHQNFASVQADAFHLSEHIESSVDNLNDLVLRFELLGRQEDQTTFDKESQSLRQWLQLHQLTGTTPEVLEIMSQIKTAFAGYVQQNSQLMKARAKTGAASSFQKELDLEEHRADKILELCEQLTVAERTAQTQFMKDSSWALDWLQELLVAQMGLLVILVGTAVIAVYRGVIGPLRIELGESRARAARHEKLASLGTLAAGVAHEIRNPLTAINIRLHSLKKNLAKDSSEQEDALIIGHEIQRLERIVQEFLQFARPADPKLLTVSADSLLARIQTLFGPQLEKAGIRLNLESVPDIWVRADPNQIEQVLINLVQNAAESMANGGVITLRARKGMDRLHGRIGPVVIIEVSDTGKGIPPEVKKRMFDPFFTTKEEGSGLGLAITVRILEKHGGTLGYRSEINRGTTFTILLPPAKPDESHEAIA